MRRPASLHSRPPRRPPLQLSSLLPTVPLLLPRLRHFLPSRPPLPTLPRQPQSKVLPPLVRNRLRRVLNHPMPPPLLLTEAQSAAISRQAPPRRRPQRRQATRATS